MAALVLVLAAVAHADPEQDAKAKQAADAGAALFQANDFAGAVSKFQEAYELNHDPSYLFNVAQAYRRANDCVHAAEFYRRFLDQVPHPPNETKIRGWYGTAQQCAKEHGQVDTPPTTELVKQQPAPPAPPHADSHLGFAIGLAATSAVAFGIGGFFAWDSSYLEDHRKAFLAGCTASNPCSAAVVNDYDGRGSRANTIAVVGLVAGVATLATGAALYFLGSDAETPPVAVVPLPGGAFIRRGWAF